MSEEMNETFADPFAGDVDSAQIDTESALDAGEASRAIAVFSGAKPALYWSSLPAGNRKLEMFAYRAMQSPTAPLDQMIGQPIQVMHVIFKGVEINESSHTDLVTGEIVKDKKSAIRIILIDGQGNSYNCTSIGVKNELERLFQAFGPAPWTPPLTLIPRKTRVDAGNLLTLELAE